MDYELRLFETEEILTEDECCIELQNDERYVDYACHPHSHVEADIFSFDAVSSTCTRNVITQKNWYLPSVFTAA